MVDATIESELTAFLNTMPVERQREVLEFARKLATQQRQGALGPQLLRFAGLIPESDLDAMEQAIKQGCERVDDDGW